MLRSINHLLLLGLGLLFALGAAAENFKYSELQIRDYDEMLKDVTARVVSAKKISMEKQAEGADEEGDREAIEILRTTLKLILSRPNEDNMVAKLIPVVRSELNNFSAFEDTLSSVADEALRAINNDKLPVVYRGTSLFILENLMSEIRPEIENKEEFKLVITKIRDAKIEIPEKVKNERKLRSMYNTKNPSTIAAAILKDEEALAKKRAERAAAKAKADEKAKGKKSEEKD
ncbi:MAG: hypothetical protein KDD43_10005 [Bdellovibrionales bacterium]|nr:hypothetical protein [Bdellovibrionales bacterium]